MDSSNSPATDVAAREAALRQLAARHGCSLAQTGVVVVDHGSRRDESNQMLADVVEQLVSAGPFSLVEAAHMELAEPSMATAVGRCVARGARLVIVSPFFLLPGKHWTEDLPRLAQEASSLHGGVPVVVAAPLGLHPWLAQVLLERMAELGDDRSTS